MANKSPALTDPDYQARLEEAYQKLVESLDQRKNRFFDPSYLAAAQAFATPTKTGSGFEALGNVAGAVGRSQEEEAKREFEINKSKFDINKELLALQQQQKRTQFGMSELGDAQLAGQPPAGALPGQPPVEGGALTSAVGAAPGPGIKQAPLEVEPQGALPPMQPVKTPGTPQPELVDKNPVPPPPAPAGALPPAAPPPTTPLAATAGTPGPMGLTREGGRIARFAFSEGAPLADAYKKGADFDAVIAKQRNDEAKLRNEEAKLKIDQGDLDVKKGQLENAVEATKQGNYKVVGSALVDLRDGKPVYISGGTSVKIGDGTYTGTPDKIDAYVNASRAGDTQTVQRIGAELMGLNGKPGGKPIKSEEQKAQEKLDEAAEREAKKELKTQALKSEQKRQEELVSRMEAIKTQKSDTKTLIEIFNKKDVQKVLGPTAKPGVKAAIGELVSGGLNVGGYQVAMANFDKAIVNMGATQDVIDQLNVASSLLSKAELLNARTYLKGEGTVTNMERGIVKDINGLAYKDPSNALLFKSQLAYAQANMNERYIKTFQSWRDKNPDGTIEQFNRTKAYDTIESDYHDELKKINKTIGLGPKPTEAPKKESGLTAARNKINSLLQ